MLRAMSGAMSSLRWRSALAAACLWGGLLTSGLLTSCGGRVVVARELGPEADAGVTAITEDAVEPDAGIKPRRQLRPSRNRLRKPLGWRDGRH